MSVSKEKQRLSVPHPLDRWLVSRFVSPPRDRESKTEHVLGGRERGGQDAFPKACL